MISRWLWSNKELYVYLETFLFFFPQSWSSQFITKYPHGEGNLLSFCPCCFAGLHLSDHRGIQFEPDNGMIVRFDDKEKAVIISLDGVHSIIVEKIPC